MSRASPRYHRVNPPMPGIPSGSSVARYIIQGSIEGQMTISSFDMMGGVASPTQAQLTTLITNCSTLLLAKYRACVSADWTVVREIINVISRNDILGYIATSNAGAAGTRAAGHEPTEVAQPLIKTSALKGQHGRGRLSLPAIATADVGASIITSAALITAIVQLEVAMVGTVSDGVNNWTLGLSQRSNASPRLAVGFTPVLNVIRSPLLGTVRRRKIGRGR